MPNIQWVLTKYYIALNKKCKDKYKYVHNILSQSCTVHNITVKVSLLDPLPEPRSTLRYQNFYSC